MAFYRQPCDTFFVEDPEDSQRRFRDEMREREKYDKQQTQRALADDLSRATSYEYRDDILKQMEAIEAETMPDVASIDIQTEIQWFMRPYLLDFLTEAHAAFGLLPETLFLAINLLDRYCSRRIVYKKHYQLVGCSALLIAAKYGDRKECVPTIRELNTMCCGLYDDDMFTQMEWHVLQTLDWAIGHPTIDNFVQLAVEHHQYDPEVENMALFIAEIALFQKEFVAKRASDLARSALALARCILNRPQALHSEWASGYDSQTLVSLSQQLHHPSTILSRKYSTANHSRVSVLLDAFLARQASIVKSGSTSKTPPSPPSESSGHFEGPMPNPVTPQKRQFFPHVDNGCPTPPITPTNQEYFLGHPTYEPFQRPPTPSSMKCDATYNPSTSSFILPSIHQMAPAV